MKRFLKVCEHKNVSLSNETKNLANGITLLGRVAKDINITGLRHHACEMFNTFKAQRKADYIDLNDIPMVQESLNNIITKTKDFINAWEED
jgi:tRNA/tmRNA/rRNA uracil-C5-methylase (TrmA/RlmC/RlmD family)